MVFPAHLGVTVHMQGSVWKVTLHNEDTLNKDLACDLLCKTSAESGLIVGNFPGIVNCAPDMWCFLSRRLCHSLTRKVSSVCTTTALGLIREEKSHKVIHGLASRE